MSSEKYKYFMFFLLVAPLSFADVNDESDKGDINHFIQSWLTAWREKNIGVYQSLYTRNIATSPWVKGRERVFSKAGKIQLDISEPIIVFEAPGKARVSFCQKYQSKVYADNVEKILLLEKTKSGWNISKEMSVIPSCDDVGQKPVSVVKALPLRGLPDPVAPSITTNVGPSANRRNVQSNYSAQLSAKFEQGLVLPVFLRTKGVQNSSEAGKLSVRMVSGKLLFVSFSPSQEFSSAPSNVNLLAELNKLQGLDFDANSSIKVGRDAELKLDPVKLDVTLLVNEDSVNKPLVNAGSVGRVLDKDAPIQPIAQSVQIDKLALSSDLKEILSEGVSVPLIVRSAEQPTEEGVTSELMLTIQLQEDNTLKLLKIKPVISKDKKVLSKAAVAELTKSIGKIFAGNGELQVSDTMRLQLDMLAMRVDLYLAKKDFALDAAKMRESILPSSSSDGFSSLLKYSFNGYYSKTDYDEQSSGYLSFDNMSSIGVNHLNILGSAYLGSSSTDQAFSLNRFMYERDIEGKRLALGMVDDWNLQSLGNVSTLSGNQMYGFSYGNVSQTLKLDQSQSLNPIDVYLPATGEVRIKRDGRILSSQRMGMGNHRLDTSSLQAGTYDVEVEVVIAGQVQSTRTYRINKPYGGSSLRDGLNWQVWGGATKVTSYYGQEGMGNDANRTYKPLLGVSVGSVWKDIDWNLTLYQNDKTTVQEGYAAWQMTDFMRGSLQNLSATDGTWRGLATLNLDLPKNLGSVWLTGERGKAGKELNYYARDYNSIGANLNLGIIHRNLGSLNLNYDQDKNADAKYVRYNYSQQVYSGRWGSAQLQLGQSRSTSPNFSDKQAYGMLNLNIPLNASFGVGLSHRDGSNTLDLTASKAIDNSVIDYIGANASINRDQSSGNSTNYGAYASFDGRYGQGTISVDANDSGYNTSLNVQGGVALGNGKLAMGSGQDNAAVIIDVPQIEHNALEAVVNNQSYLLHQGRNLISIQPYETYRVYIRGAQDSDSSYEVSDGDHEFTLYPGNVVQVEPKIKQMVTVFGQLTKADGSPLVSVTVRNHIGYAVTDEKGNFALDVDKLYPEMSVEQDGNDPYLVNMNLKEAGATAWLGKVVYGDAVKRVYSPQDQDDV